MKIAGISARTVSVPLERPTRWSLGTHAAAVRVVYELGTEDGVVGHGESHAVSDVRRLVTACSELLEGLSPLEVGLIQRRLDPLDAAYETMLPPGLRAGIEMAALDAAGKTLGLSVSTLLGGPVRDRVDGAAYLFQHQGGSGTPAELLARAEELVEQYGFRTLKVKGGVMQPGDDVEAVRLLAERFPEAPLRLDPNAAWSVPTALAVVDRLRAEGLGLEYLEDPTPGLEGMAEVRRRTSMPLATNMCVVAFEHLAPAVRMGSVDVVLADPHYWGGFGANRLMMAVCSAFGLGVGMHSDNDLGLSTAAKVHLAAVSPALTFAIDTHHPEHPSDLLTVPIPFTDGSFEVPTGPGLGVELDADAVAAYEIEL